MATNIYILLLFMLGGTLNACKGAEFFRSESSGERSCQESSNECTEDASDENGSETEESAASLLSASADNLVVDQAGDGSESSPFVFAVIADAGLAEMSLSDDSNDSITCKNMPAEISSTGTNPLVLKFNYSTADLGNVVFNCISKESKATFIKLVIRASALNLTGSNDPATSISTRTFDETYSTWEVTGHCDYLLGDVTIGGEGVDTSFKVACNDSGNFSGEINYATTSPKFYDFPSFGRKTIEVSQAEIFTKSVFLYRSYSTITVIEISTVDQLEAMATRDGTKMYILTADLDVAAANGPTNNWTPLGSFGDEFIAIIEGNGHTISNLNFTGVEASFLGWMDTGTFYAGGGRTASVANLTLENLYFNSGGGGAGGLAYIIGTLNIIANLNITGSVIGIGGSGGIASSANMATYVHNTSFVGTVNGGGRTGGFIAYANSTYLTDSYFEGDVTSTGDAGGLIGETVGNGKVSNCWSKGTVSGGSRVGGLVGDMDSGTIMGSYSEADVSAVGGDQVGGVVGMSDGIVIDSYATGSVSGASQIGGLIGYHTSSVTPERIFSTGTVTGSGTEVGRLIGEVAGGSPSQEDAFYFDSSSCTGCDNSIGDALTSTQLKAAANFSNFDFDSVWKLGAIDTHPHLQWE